MTGPTHTSRCLAGIVAAALAIVSILFGYVTAAHADVKPASPSTVAADLGANKIPAALVILVDISDSMAVTSTHHGLYPQVLIQLRKFLAALIKQDPQDRVAVVVFGNRNDTRTVYPMGPPTANIPLPSVPNSLGTDIGYAFEVALDNLAQAPKDIQVGGILLLSDAGNWEPNDPIYDGGLGYNAPGWPKLLQRVRGFGMPVTAYGLPLTTNPGDINALNQALTAAFGPQQVMLSPDFSNLTSQLDVAQQKILNKRVAAAAAPDSGKGVKVTWSGPEVSQGTLHLDLSAGQANPTVTLTAMTNRVPLDVTRFSVQVTGFPIRISGKVRVADVMLKPHQSVTVPVHLTWPAVTGGHPSWSGRITLRGRVNSPFSNAIQKYYEDNSFTVGRLGGGISVAYQAAIPSSLSPFVPLLLILLILLGLAGLAYYRARLSGSLILNFVGDFLDPVDLPPRPWFTWQIDKPAAVRGQLIVRGSPISRNLNIRHSKHPETNIKFPRGGQAMIAGIDIVHRDGTRRRSHHRAADYADIPEEFRET